MLIDGKTIAQSILEEVAAKVESMSTKPSLTVLACAPNFETKKYLALKQSRAESLGIEIVLEILNVKTNTTAFIDAVVKAVKLSDGIIIQLPLPSHLDTQAILESIPVSHDVDAFSYGTDNASVLPPVVGAIDAIAQIHNVDWKGKKVVVFGAGRLVGLPAVIYVKSQGAEVIVINKDSGDVESQTLGADIIILGAGKANLLKPDMVKEGVMVFDAGASEDGGLLAGDADPAVAYKSSLFTPVPGGIGPITIAVLFSNLLELRSRQ